MLRIVTPTLGKSPWLSDALVKPLSLGDGFEQVLVAPLNSCDELRRIYVHCRVIPQVGSGLYDALNVGFGAAGEWTIGTWINDDDRLLAEGFGEGVSQLLSHRELAGVYGRVKMIDSRGRCLAEIPVARRGADLGPLLAVRRVPFAQPGTVFRREVFAQLGGFRERMRAAGDMEFFQRALEVGFRFEFIDAQVAEFRVHRDQISKQEEIMSQESREVFARAGMVPGWRDLSRGALRRFRLVNLGVYIDRIWRHGFVSMQTLYERR